MPILTALVLLASTLGQQPEAAMQKTTSEFSALELKLMGAAQLKNTAEEEALISPDFAFSMALEGRPNYVLNRSEWMNGISYYDLKNFSIGDLTAHPLDKSTVVTHFRLIRSAKMGQTVDMSGEFVMTDVWVKVKNQWQLYRRFVSRPAAVPTKK